MENLRRFMFTGLLLLFVAALSGCGGGGGGNSTPGTNTTTTTSSSTADALFTAAADPVNVTVTTDSAKASTQTVTSAGGTLNATSADGSQFTLVIPAGALTQDTSITMTPISSISGLPFTNGLVAAVQLTPDGLSLQKNATLTIVLPSSVSVPVANQTFFGYLASGKDLHMASPASNSSAIQLDIPHFSGWGLGNATSADRAALYLKRAADHAARIEQEIARYLSQERYKQLLGVSDEGADFSKLGDLIKSYYGLVVRPRVLAASASCENAQLALKTVLGYMRQLSLLGAEGAYKDFNSDLDTVLKAAASTCAFQTTAVTAGDLTVSSQTICTLSKPFTLAMGGGVSGTFRFTPIDIISGTVSDSAIVTNSGFTMDGSGTYTVTGIGMSLLTLTNPILTIQATDCIHIPIYGDSCRTNTLPIPLKWLDHGC